VAEGIETEAQAVLLRELGCHLGQGYLYGRALPELPHREAAIEQPAGPGIPAPEAPGISARAA